MKVTTTEAAALPVKGTRSGFALPVYGLGTWGIGGTFSADATQDEASVAGIRGCLDLGVQHIDTAEMYGNGHTEELIGRAIQGYPRTELFLGSKVLAHHLRYDDVIAAAERSIQRMGCDYLDLYLIHHPNDEIPIAETMRGMDHLVRRGLVRHIGVSNFTRERLTAAQHHATHKIEVNQVHYSLTVREPERTGLLEYCQRHDLILVAWQPIDRGIYTRTNASPLLQSLCARYQRTPLQIALSWVVSQSGVVAICRTLSAAHLRENIAGATTNLSPEDVELLRKHFKPQQECSEVFPLR